MANVRVFPPGDGLHPTIVVNGRSYTCALGATLDVPDFDAAVFAANGWTVDCVAGPTSGRPNPPSRGTPPYYDTTLSFHVIHDGKNWRRSDTGAVA